MAFTDAEKVELLKIIEARQLIGDATYNMGVAISNEPSSNRQDFYELLAQLWTGSRRLGNGGVFMYVTGTPVSLSDQRFTLAERIGPARSAMEESVLFLGRARDAAAASSVPRVQRVEAQLVDAIDLLQSFDFSLPFADPKVKDAPGSVGPHGHFDLARSTMMRVDRYLIHHAWGAAAGFYGRVSNWPEGNQSGKTNPSANNRMGHNILRFGRIAPLVMRIWGLDHGIVNPVDRQAIDFDTAAGSGLRDETFFRLMRAGELAFADKRMPPSFSGRPFVDGVSSFLQEIQSAFAECIQDVIRNGGEDPVDMFVGGGDSTSAAAKPGRGMEFFRTFGDGWRTHDRYNQGIFGFYFEIPAPQGQVISCGPGTHFDPGTVSCLPNDSIPPGDCPDCPEVPVLDVEITVDDGADVAVFEGRRKL